MSMQQTILDIESSTEADAGVVEAKITAFNKMEVPFTQGIWGSRGLPAWA